MLEVETHGRGQRGALNLPPLAHEVLDLVAMTDRRDPLGDDRSRIEFRRHVVGRGADQFHTALMSPVVGLGASEGGQEGVVDVDHPTVPSIGDLLGEDAHVTSQHHKVGSQFIEGGGEGRLLRCSGLAAVSPA